MNGSKPSRLSDDAECLEMEIINAKKRSDEKMENFSKRTEDRMEMYSNRKDEQMVSFQVQGMNSTIEK